MGKTSQKCKLCKQWTPLDDFYLSRKLMICKICDPIEVLPTTKKCTLCRKHKAFADFYILKTGLDHRCKQCHTENKRKWRKNNPERAAQWHKNNKEEILLYQKQYWEENKELIAQKRQELRIKNPDLRKKLIEKTKEWQKKNPEKIRIQGYRRHYGAEFAEIFMKFADLKKKKNIDNS